MPITLRKKKEWAKLLFIKSSLTQKEIAAQVGVTEATLSKWANDPRDNWEMHKASIVITKENELKRIYIQISELNTAIQTREEGHRYATAKEADTLSKLAAAARNLEKDSSASDVINVSMEIIQYLQESDPQRAKEFSYVLDAFIKFKLAKIGS